MPPQAVAVCILSFFFGLAAFGSAPVSAQGPLNARSSAAKAAMIAGTAAAEAGDLVRARREFSHAVSLAPQVPATHAALGVVLLTSGDPGAALPELERAHALAPSDVSNNLNLAHTEALLRHEARAVALFREALASSPEPALSQPETLAYARALAETGNAAEAQRLLSRSLTESPDSAPLEDALGSSLADGGQLAEALPHLQHAVLLDPSRPESQYHLGDALLNLDRFAEALAPLKFAATTLPRNFEAHLQYGRALSATHRDGEAVNALRQALELRSSATSPEALDLLAQSLQASGDPAAALPLFVQLASSGVVSSSLLTNYALARVQTGDADGALALYAGALALGPDSATLREDYGAAFLQKQDLDHALEQFRAGLVLEPENPHLHYDAGLALKLKDNLEAAIAELQRAAELDPTLPDPPYTLGVLLMQQGHEPAAAAQLKRTVALAPENGDAWALLGSVLKDTGDAPGAIDALHRAVKLQPDQPSLHIQLATLEAKAGDAAAATEDRKIAADLSRLALSRQRAGFALKSGRALLAANKLDEAVHQLRVAAEADPTLAEPHQLLAEAYTRSGDRAAAALERSRAQALQASLHLSQGSSSSRQ